MEHRWGERRPINLAVGFVITPGKMGTGRIINISSTGAFMVTEIPLRRLSLLLLRPMDSIEGENKQIAATVVRQEARGVGLEWCEFEAETMKSYLRLASATTAGPKAHSQPTR
jgi:PilZ domain